MKVDEEKEGMVANYKAIVRYLNDRLHAAGLLPKGIDFSAVDKEKGSIPLTNVQLGQLGRLAGESE